MRGLRAAVRGLRAVGGTDTPDPVPEVLRGSPTGSHGLPASGAMARAVLRAGPTTSDHLRPLFDHFPTTILNSVYRAIPRQTDHDHPYLTNMTNISDPPPYRGVPSAVTIFYLGGYPPLETWSKRSNRSDPRFTASFQRSCPTIGPTTFDQFRLS